MKARVEPIAQHRDGLSKLLAEAEDEARRQLGHRSLAPLKTRWRAMIEAETGFALQEDSECVGILLYSAEYELGLSAFLSDSSAVKLPRSATISSCYVTEEARRDSSKQERLLLREAIRHLRSLKSIETIAVQIAPQLYELRIEGKLARMGFMNCRRVRMEHSLAGRIPKVSAPPGCRLAAPVTGDQDDLRSVIYHGYFSELDGYLFPDISVVCADPELFSEFYRSELIDHRDSVLARMLEYPSGCVITLVDRDTRTGLIGVVAVVPGMRRKGIARAMLTHVMRALQEHGCQRAALAVTVENQPAISLYRSLGFKEVGPSSSISVWRRSVSRPLMLFPR
jgi:ribosomal protein S18 acetylase RimI-like enzyme